MQKYMIVKRTAKMVNFQHLSKNSESKIHKAKIFLDKNGNEYFATGQGTAIKIFNISRMTLVREN